MRSRWRESVATLPLELGDAAVAHLQPAGQRRASAGCWRACRWGGSLRDGWVPDALRGGCAPYCCLPTSMLALKAVAVSQPGDVSRSWWFGCVCSGAQGCLGSLSAKASPGSFRRGHLISSGELGACRAAMSASAHAGMSAGRAPAPWDLLPRRASVLQDARSAERFDSKLTPVKR